MARAHIGTFLSCSRPQCSVLRTASPSRTSSLPRCSAAITTRTPLVALSSNRSALPAVSQSPPRDIHLHCRRNTSSAAAANSVKLSTESGVVDYFATDNRPIVLYDGVCNMCNGGVNFALDADPQGRLRFAALQSEAGRALLARSGRSPDDISSIVLVERDGAYIKSDAVLRIARLLDLPYPPLAFLASLAPKPLRDMVYDGVANNRYSILGMRDVCRISDGRYEDRFIS